MSNDSEKGDKIWKIVGLMIQIPFYPVHFAIRLIARFLLSAIQSAASILLLILFVIIICSSKIFDLALSKIFDLALSKTLVENPEPLESPIKLLIITIFIVLIAVVLIPHWFQRHAKDIWKSLLNTKKKICEVLRDRWLPDLDIKESLSVTWQYYGSKIRPSLKKIVNEVKELFYATLILGIILLLYAKVVDYTVSSKEWTIFNFSSILIYVQKERANHPHPDIEKKILNHPHPDIKEIPVHSHEPSYRFNKGTQFSLVYAVISG